MEERELMFCMSKYLPESEAISFAKTLRALDRFYVYLAGTNPKARHVRDRESWIVVRPLRKGEVVPL